MTPDQMRRDAETLKRWLTFFYYQAPEIVAEAFSRGAPKQILDELKAIAARLDKLAEERAWDPVNAAARAVAESAVYETADLVRAHECTVPTKLIEELIVALGNEPEDEPAEKSNAHPGPATNEDVEAVSRELRVAKHDWGLCSPIEIINAVRQMDSDRSKA